MTTTGGELVVVLLASSELLFPEEHDMRIEMIRTTAMLDLVLCEIDEEVTL
jgi:hypothetical protein